MKRFLPPLPSSFRQMNWRKKTEMRNQKNNECAFVSQFFVSNIFSSSFWVLMFFAGAAAATGALIAREQKEKNIPSDLSEFFICGCRYLFIRCLHNRHKYSGSHTKVPHFVNPFSVGLMKKAEELPEDCCTWKMFATMNDTLHKYLEF